MFIGNLQGPYLDRMVRSTSLVFFDLVLVGERIENMIKMGKIQNSTSASGASKKPFVPYGKKRDSVAAIIRTKNLTYHQVAIMAPVQQQQQTLVIPVQQPRQQQQYQPHLQPQQN